MLDTEFIQIHLFIAKIGIGHNHASFSSKWLGELQQASLYCRLHDRGWQINYNYYNIHFKYVPSQSAMYVLSHVCVYSEQ